MKVSLIENGGGMYVEEFQVTIIELNTKNKSQLRVKVDEAETTENIIIRAGICGKEILSADYNYLPAFQKFRDKLLQLGYGIKCNGARLNAVQSEMMSGVDKVYLVEMGRQALTKDIVHIWDYADINNFPDTKQQEDFWKKWKER